MSASTSETDPTDPAPTVDELRSRRSACDRCRSHKLRCLRDHNTGNSNVLQPCQRCLKAGVSCSTGPPLRPGRPSRAVREKRSSQYGGLKSSNDVIYDSAQGSKQISVFESAASSDLAMDVSPPVLVNWDNVFQPGSVDISGAGLDNPELGQEGEMELDMDFYQLSFPNDVGVNQNLQGWNSAPGSQQTSHQPVQEQDELDAPYLELTDLKEEVLKKLADLNSRLLTDLNVMRSVGTGSGCRSSSTMSLASSQRNGDGKTEVYNFMVGRMLNNAEAFLSILRCFAPANLDQTRNTSDRKSVV